MSRYAVLLKLVTVGLFWLMGGSERGDSPLGKGKGKAPLEIPFRAGIA